MDKNCLSYWFPKIHAAGLPVPETFIIDAEIDLTPLLAGDEIPGFDQFVGLLREAAKRLGYPCFMRTGQFSAKHSWQDTCLIEDAADFPSHIYQLVEESHLADFFGLPHDIWVVRELLPTKHLFYAFWGRMPITREFRCFVRNRDTLAIYPYWPADAIEQPDSPNWREILQEASAFTAEEAHDLSELAAAAGEVVGGDWSVDILQVIDGSWYITDMAVAEQSFGYNPVLYGKAVEE